MIEIIPNWHPIFVHFTVGVFTTAFGFYVLAYLSSFLRIVPVKIVYEFEVVGRWCLWIAALMTFFTVIAGLHAYNTVKHDDISHVAMTNHRNWALPTAGLIMLLAIWSAWRYYKYKILTIIFMIALFIIQSLLVCTAWRGGELVYRHGLGVISLPHEEGEGHQHHHGQNMKEMPMGNSNMPSMEKHEEYNHSD